MSLLFLFRRLAFAQVLLGLVAFCLAEPTPNVGLLLVAGALAGLSWYVVEGPLGRALPRRWINVGSLAAIGWLLLELVVWKSEMVVAMGHFMLWMQLLLLYGRKQNREYAQLLVLSLLQIIAASLLSVTMLYGLFLGAYCLLGLFTALLFQVKATSDRVQGANRAAAPAGQAAPRPRPVVGRGHRWHFRLVGLAVGLICAALATGVFLLLPRASRFQGHLSFTQAVSGVPQVGFSPEVRLGGRGPRPANRVPVLTMALSLHGGAWEPESTGWLLRGAVCQRYRSYSWRWSSRRDRDPVDPLTFSSPARVELVSLPPQAATIEAQINLFNRVGQRLFTPYPVVSVAAPEAGLIVFDPENQELFFSGYGQEPLQYRVWAALEPAPQVFKGYAQLPRPSPPKPDADLAATAPTEATAPMEEAWEELAAAFDPYQDWDPYRDWPVQVERVCALGQTILGQAGLERDLDAPSSPGDFEVARALTNYLRENYRYTLTGRPTRYADDPVIEFLFERRAGHCELFASGLVALARSVGLRARLVTGYSVHEFNRVGGYYVVRQSDAHTWAEVDCGRGHWRSFDPTPPAQLAAERGNPGGWLGGVGDLYQHLEFLWVGKVVTYDQQNRQALLERVNEFFHAVATRQRAWPAAGWRWAKATLQRWGLDELSFTAAGWTFFCLVVATVTLARILVVRRRRLQALQLTRLPQGRRRPLVKHLGFYLTTLDLLDRYGYRRPPWQSPLAFAQELAYSDPMRFDPLVALTELFYQVRFGHCALDTAGRRKAQVHLRRLEQTLSQGT